MLRVWESGAMFLLVNQITAPLSFIFSAGYFHSRSDDFGRSWSAELGRASSSYAAHE